MLTDSVEAIVLNRKAGNTGVLEDIHPITHCKRHSESDAESRAKSMQRPIQGYGRVQPE